MHRVTFFPADSRHRAQIGSDEQPRDALKAPRVRADTVTAESMDPELRAKSCSMTDFLQAVKERVMA